MLKRLCTLKVEMASSEYEPRRTVIALCPSNGRDDAACAVFVAKTLLH